MLVRAAGRQIGVMDLAPAGLAHVTVERAEVLTALAGVLPPRSVSYGVRCEDVGELAGDHDLVVIADGAHSLLREAVAPTSGRRWRWTVWQACVTADLPELPAGAGLGVMRQGMFVGIFRLGGGRLTWFVELPGRNPGNREQLFCELSQDQDPCCARLPPPPRSSDGPSGTPWTFGRGDRCLAATLFLLATPRTRCWPQQLKVPAKPWRTPSCSPAR
jgi:hypothetical protein